MARRYHVQGSKHFLIAAIVLMLLGLWCVRDGWFPSEAVRAEKTAHELASFMQFNKSLALLLLVGSVICGYIHTVVR
ncbi:MAG TPA: hypothetical protein P5567_05490 [Kiritimatiellia bacterium]|nr:hypothetical protein [Kiritimatiellia bacterium]HRZ11891.1 hypothetical protein [Kiritimatiellia bacterium]HSA17303.1 hypothetical protein [Kiritimatiellia bacterium]